MKAFEKISTAKKHNKLPVKESQSAPAMRVKQKVTDQMHLILGVRSYDIFDKKLAALKVLATALGGGMSSRLFHRMRDQMGVCYYVRAGSDELTDHGAFTISAGVDKNRLKESVQAILEECKKFISEKLSDAELRKVKDYIIGNMYLGLESSDSVAEFIGMQEILKKESKKPADLAEKIEKVTATDVQKVAKDIFKDKNLNLAVIGDVKDEDGVKKLLTFGN
jgi:predicted Zn-dependent peptidase